MGLPPGPRQPRTPVNPARYQFTLYLLFTFQSSFVGLPSVGMLTSRPRQPQPPGNPVWYRFSPHLLLPFQSPSMAAPLPREPARYQFSPHLPFPVQSPWQPHSQGSPARYQFSPHLPFPVQSPWQPLPKGAQHDTSLVRIYLSPSSLPVWGCRRLGGAGAAGRRSVQVRRVVEVRPGSDRVPLLGQFAAPSRHPPQEHSGSRLLHGPGLEQGRIHGQRH